MLGEIFYWALNMSMAAAVSGGVVLLLRRIHAIPRRVIAVLWIIPYLRMWIPVGVGSKYSLMALLSQAIVKTVPVYGAGDPAWTMVNFVKATDSYFPTVFQTPLLAQVFRTAALVWLISAAALVIAGGLVYGTTLHELRDAQHLRGRLYLSHRIESPAVYGVFHPKILLPIGYETKDLTFIEMHENAHIRRGDNLWRLLGFITAAIHWYNPLAWIFLTCFLTDIELSCDEQVLAKCDDEQKKAYALSLIACAEKTAVFASAFGGAKIRLRIQRILSYRKLSVLSAVGFIGFIAVVAYILLTNAG